MYVGRFYFIHFVALPVDVLLILEIPFFNRVKDIPSVIVYPDIVSHSNEGCSDNLTRASKLQRRSNSTTIYSNHVVSLVISPSCVPS